MTITMTTRKRLAKYVINSCTSLLLLATASASAEVTLVSSTKIADNALHFDGKDIDSYKTSDQSYQDDALYHYKFGGSISAHGDSVKVYKHYVFMTWYKGGKLNREVMLSRLNTQTGKVTTIEFPHKHTGFQGKWWIGESHNTIGLAVSPIDGTIHMVYDMHAYSDTKFDGIFKDDYFRYSYSVPGAAGVPDEEFTLAQFVKDTSAVSQGDDDYKHLVMTGDLGDKLNFSELTYPSFFKTTEDDLLLYMRWGGNNNGAYYYNRYDTVTSKWSRMAAFNHKNQKSVSSSDNVLHNWGLYGDMKYFNGKLHVGFQRRSANNDDKFIYQNGIYYAYLDDPENNIWRDHRGNQITWPLVDSEEIKIFEPGDLVETTSNSANDPGTPPGKVYIVGGFDWAMTDKGDLHFVHLVQDREFNKTVYGHLYKPAGATDFIHVEIEGSGELYASGDNIYVIGLDNKKPYVDVAKGGTTDFERIYTDTTTTTNFQHGVLHIEDGKVYYYLMESKTGTSRPLHLQVIDLGIPKLSIAFESSSITVDQGYDSLHIAASASAVDESTAISSVTLYLNDESVSTLTAAPYVWTEQSVGLQAITAGDYILKAVVTDSNGNTAESSMTLSVVEPDTPPTVSFAEQTIEVEEGYNQLSVAVEASTSMTTRTINNVALYIDDELVAQDFSAPYQWDQTNPYLQGLPVGDYTLKAVVTDSNQSTSEDSIRLTVSATVSPENGNKTDDNSSGGSSPGLAILSLLFVALHRKRLQK